MPPWVASLLAAASVAVLLTPGAGALRVGTVLRGRGHPLGEEPRWTARPWLQPLALRGNLLAPGSLRAGVGRSIAAAAAALVCGAGPVVGALAAVGAACAAWWWARRARTRERQRERARAVEACAALAGELRAGRSPAQALEVAAGLAVGASRTALSTAAAAAGLGGDVAGALRPVAGTATAVPEVLRALAACWTVCASSGGGLAAAVERLEQGLRADQAQRQAVQAELAGPRATAGMLAVLPLAGLVLAAGLGADPLHVLLETPVGLVCLVAGLGLDGLGLLWTDRLVARAGGTG